MRYLVIVLFGFLSACGGSDNDPTAAVDNDSALATTAQLQDGVVFLNPADDSTQLMVVAHQIPQPIFIQSVMLEANHICQSDTETQLMYQVTAWSLQTSGVPAQSVGKYSLAAP